MPRRLLENVYRSMQKMIGEYDMKKTLAHIISFIAALWFIVALLFTSLQLCLNDEAWFLKEYEKFGISRYIMIDTEDCTAALMRLVGYMEGKYDTIQLEVVENGRVVEMYNEREIDHMVDVRNLYQAFRLVRDIGIAAVAVMIAAVIIMKRREALSILAKEMLRAGTAFVVILAALGLWVVLDFGSFWTAFHHLFFTNDLWLLDYATDRMIRICPQELFFDIIVRFALFFLAAFAALMAGAFVAAKRRNK